MNQANDGGPAFPVPDTHYPNGQVQFGTCGMTLRDYFAAAALQGLAHRVAFDQDIEDKLKVNGIKVADFEKWTAFAAYGFADAMLAERAKQEGK